MPTVDDLIISLTIKPTSNLGRLQKQLDSIVGRTGKGVAMRGVGTGFMYLKKDMTEVKSHLSHIRNVLKLISPKTVGGLGMTALHKFQATQIRNVIDSSDIGELAKRFKPEGLSAQRQMAKELGVPLEDLEEAIVQKLEQEFIPRLDFISAGLDKGDRTTQQILWIWEQIQATGDMPIKKTWFSALLKAQKEQNYLMLEYLKSKGLDVEFEGLKLRLLNDKSKEEILEHLGDWSKKQLEDEDLTGINTAIDYMNKVLEKEGIQDPVAFVKQTVAEINTQLPGFVDKAIAVALEKGGGLPLKWFQHMRDLAVKEGLVTEKTVEGMGQMSKIDFVVQYATEKALEDAGLDELIATHVGTPISFIEQKQSATKASLDELNRYIRTVGLENIGLVASSVAKSIQDSTGMAFSILDIFAKAIENNIIDLDTKLAESVEYQQTIKDALVEKMGPMDKIMENWKAESEEELLENIQLHIDKLREEDEEGNADQIKATEDNKILLEMLLEIAKKTGINIFSKEEKVGEPPT